MTTRKIYLEVTVTEQLGAYDLALFVLQRKGVEDVLRLQPSNVMGAVNGEGSTDTRNFESGPSSAG